MLPKLVVNGYFMRDFINAETPCCALGVIEEGDRKLGLIALRLNDIISNEILDQGMNFGHQLLGTDTYEVVYFGVEFYGYKTYNMLINPNDPVSQAVLQMMLQTGEYFILLINSDKSVTAFRSEFEKGTLIWLKTYFSKIKESNTTDAEYRRAVAAYEKNPTVPGEMLQWVCRDDARYLDLNNVRLELNPSK